MSKREPRQPVHKEGGSSRRPALNKVLFVRADEDLVNALEALKQKRANLRGLSMADTVRMLLWEAVNAHEAHVPFGGAT